MLRLLLIALCCSCGAAIHSTNASTATGDRRCVGGVDIVYSQPQRTTLVRGNGVAADRYLVAINADTDNRVSLWTQESMNCPDVAMVHDQSCGGVGIFCNHGQRLACDIYRKPAGESTWHLSRSGSVDFNQATYDSATGEYRFKFSAASWGSDGPSGCGGEADHLTVYEFHSGP